MLQTISHPNLLLMCVLVLCGAGAWISGELLKAHDRVWASAGQANTGLLARACGSGCAGASKGPWSQVKVPILRPHRDFTFSLRTKAIPVAFLGLAYFVFLGTWFLFIGGPRPIGLAWHRLIFAFAFLGTAASLFYLGVMALGRAPWCVGCVAVHGINFMLLLLAWRLYAASPAAHTAAAISSLSLQRVMSMTLTSREAIHTIAFACIIIVGLFGYRRSHLVMGHHLTRLAPYKAKIESLQRDPEFLLRQYHAQRMEHIPAKEGQALQKGHAQMVVFVDYECPACRCHALQMRNEVIKTFGENLAVSIRHYPLCNTCNTDLTGNPHPNACDAAHAAEAARVLGGQVAFNQMHNLLFQNNKRLGEETYRELAVQIGLDPISFFHEMRSDRVRRVVQNDIRLAQRLKVSGTPIVYLNGRRVPELCQNTVFWGAMAAKQKKNNTVPLASASAIVGNNPVVITAH